MTTSTRLAKSSAPTMPLYVALELSAGDGSWP